MELAEGLDASQPFLDDKTLLAAAADGKTSCQSYDEQGKPEHLINLLLHDLKIVLSYLSDNSPTSNARIRRERVVLPE
jgi:hypothetical protein